MTDKRTTKKRPLTDPHPESNRRYDNLCVDRHAKTSKERTAVQAEQIDIDY